MSRPIQLTFLGGAGTVTGSRTLVSALGRNVLVDCGLFQGYKTLRLMNREPFGFDPGRLDAVVLTHAHLDHSGALPLLMKQGFRGPVFPTPATIELAETLLPDSGRLQEEDAEYVNRRKISKHVSALPLYTEQDARDALQRFEALPFDEINDAIPGIRLRMRPAGHILGAASVEISLHGATVQFSGGPWKARRPHHACARPRDSCHRDVRQAQDRASREPSARTFDRRALLGLLARARRSGASRLHSMTNLTMRTASVTSNDDRRASPGAAELGG